MFSSARQPHAEMLVKAGLLQRLRKPEGPRQAMRGAAGAPARMLGQGAEMSACLMGQRL